MSASIPKDALRTIFAAASGLPEKVVLWDGEPVPFVGPRGSSRGTLTLNVTARRKLGDDEERREYPTPTTTKLTIVGNRVITIQARLEGFGEDEAFDTLEQVRAELAREGVAKEVRDAGLAVSSIGDILGLNGTAENREISVASLDVFFNQVVVFEKSTEDSGYIESVEMTGEDELAGAGTFTVTEDDPGYDEP